MDSPERVCKCRVWKLGIPQNATIPCVAGLPHVMKSSDWSIPNDQSALRESDSFEIQQRVSVIETLRSAERKVLIRVLWYSAARSRHVHDEQDPIATCIRRNIVACFTDTIWKIEYTPWENSHSVNSLIETQYTPRCCSRDDRILTRKYDRCPNPPEWDGCKQPGKVASLTTFDTTWGHLLHQWDNKNIQTMFAWLNLISDRRNQEIHIKETGMGSRWYGKDIAGSQTWIIAIWMKEMHGDTIEIQMESNLCLSCAGLHWSWCDDNKGKDQDIYPIPSQSTWMRGIGSNNVSINIGFHELKGHHDMEKRTFKDDMIGFLCAGHTSHSQDAGRARRLCSDTRIRVLSPTMLPDTFGS